MKFATERQRISGESFILRSMENSKGDFTVLLSQKCQWRAPRKNAKKTVRSRLPRLRVVNGIFVVISETEPAFVQA